jgi:hypothetical protein
MTMAATWLIVALLAFVVFENSEAAFRRPVPATPPRPARPAT